jgi:DNA-binding response OmpR family regulator
MPGKGTILIVEDDHFLSSLLKARLEKEGFVVYHGVDGEEGLKLFREVSPDMALIDLILPRLSGFEVLEAISMDPQFNRIPVIVLTNLAQESDIEKAKSLGAIDYFVKVKISIDDIIHKVEEVMSQGGGEATQ